MKSLQELAAIRDRMRQTVNTREPGEDPIRIQVGMATCGIAMGARPVLNAFTEEIARRDLTGVMVTQTGCLGICKYEPVVEVFVPGQEKVTYIHMTPDNALALNVHDNDEVFVLTKSYGRALIYADVVVRVSWDYRLAMHVDTDEANAFSSDAEPYGVIVRLFDDNYSTDKWIEEVLSGIHR